MAHTVTVSDLLDDDGFIVVEDTIAMTTERGGKRLSYRFVTSGETPQAAVTFIVQSAKRDVQIYTALDRAVATYNAA